MKRLIITLAAAATAAGASAQQWGGLLMDKDLLMPTDMIELSQTQFNFGTARAMAIATGVIGSNDSDGVARWLLSHVQLPE